MTSEERREARRRRREAKRAARKAERQAPLTLETVAATDALYKAAMKAKNGVQWKASTQRYMKDVLRNVSRSRGKLLAGEDVRRGFNEFDLTERGKLRHIASVHFSERVVQKSLSQNVLVPALTPSFIRNNTANTRGRGTEDAIRRLKRDLVRHYRRHGSEGWILLIDFHDYFGSIPHCPMCRIISDAVYDRAASALASSFINSWGDVGLSLGSEPNQVCAVAYPGRMDHWMTEVARLPYGRYMDDSYALSADKAELQAALAHVREMCGEMGLSLNEKKTRIVKLSKGFTWLKKRWGYADNGRIVVRPCRDSVTRERRKLKAQARLVASGEMTTEQAEQSYQSWLGSMKRLDAHKTVLRMEALHRELFGGA